MLLGSRISVKRKKKKKGKGKKNRLKRLGLLLSRGKEKRR
jgi:hypothetical protein